ncbi:MAG: paraquat-inducible protein A [Deltaproteobacteria bacterium]|nr:paraquat-inducible protein A [Deltaproteobacteria bacterium]
MTAMEAGLALCRDCGKLLPITGRDMVTSGFCPRCGARIRLRKSDSLVRTWALVVTAAILAFPANLLPIMRVDYLGVPGESTIMDGIIYFFQEGSYAIGIIILTASILVPLFKITGIILILLSIHFKWKTWLRHKSLMFRTIGFIGRWSMLDIFVISLLQVLVNFGYLTYIEVAPAATYFAGVVLATMFAAITLDPRLMWDL